MTEHDLGLKVGARSLMWAMGYSTRLDVELRGEGGRRTGKGSAPETFTDLDVLGVLVTADIRLSTAIADCKTGTRDKPTARMFWARGVADLFGADTVMLVREHDVADATRQLSSRLGITVLPSQDLQAMQALHGPPLSSSSGPLGLMFDRKAVAEHLAAFTGLNRKLKPLTEYREFDYWVYDEHRNPFQMVAHLRQVHEHLDPKNPIHLALFLDLTWLYLVALVHVIQHIRGAFLSDPDRGLQEYLFGGPTALREKEETAALLNQVKPENAADRTHLPPYFRDLRELVARLLRRPSSLQQTLRYAEAASTLMAAKKRIALPEAFTDDGFDIVTAKLVADVCGFLVEAGNLDPQFRIQARAYLLSEPVNTTGSRNQHHHVDAEDAAPQTNDSGIRPAAEASSTAPQQQGPEAASPGQSEDTPRASEDGPDPDAPAKAASVDPTAAPVGQDQLEPGT